MVEDHPECFTKEMKKVIEENPTQWPMFIFYYFEPTLDGCNLENTAGWQTMKISTKPSELEMRDVKYPEIDKIWSDGKLIATLIFTPANNFKNDDWGVKGYPTMVQLITKRFGTPLEGRTPGSLLIDPVKMPQYKMTYELADGREILFYLVLWNDSWQGDEEGVGRNFKEMSATSDYISYNGHSGYGDNIKKLEEWTQVQKGKYQLFYVDGCSTFAYVKDVMFKKHADINPGEPASRYLDVITNVQPSYFSKMPEQNIHIINGLVAMNQSYLEMFTLVENNVSTDKNPMIIVSGEEDNTYIPR